MLSKFNRSLFTRLNTSIVSNYRYQSLQWPTIPGESPGKSSQKGYYILLPEDMPDTAETNAIMRNNDPIPAFNEITAEKLRNGIVKMSTSLESIDSELIEDFQCHENKKKTFENILLPIELVLAPFSYAVNTARHLSFIDPYSVYSFLYTNLRRKINRAESGRFKNKEFYSLLNELQNDKKSMTPLEQRLVEKNLEKCVSNGVHLEGKLLKDYQQISKLVRIKQVEFISRLNYATKRFRMMLFEQEEVEGISDRIKKMTAQDKTNINKGPWEVKMSDETFEHFIKYSPNRLIRRGMYEAYYSRAADSDKLSESNIQIIDDIRDYRHEEATRIRGSKDYASYVINDKTSANSVDNVIVLLNEIKRNFKGFLLK
jgi:Zn-dependent oligopeptidase